MNPKPGNAEALTAARRADSAGKRTRVLAALDRQVSHGVPITFAGVAREAQVSIWLAKAAGLREAIEGAMREQVESGPAPTPAAAATQPLVSRRSLLNDLALTRGELGKTRKERDHLKARLRLQLGSQLDSTSHDDLVARIEGLTERNHTLQRDLDAARLQSRQQQNEISELQADLTAARAAMKKVIRQANAGGPSDLT